MSKLLKQCINDCYNHLFFVVCWLVLCFQIFFTFGSQIVPLTKGTSWHFYKIKHISECFSQLHLFQKQGPYSLFSWFPFHICNTHAPSSAWDQLMGDDFWIDLPFSQTKGTKGWAISPRLAAFGPERGEILCEWRASMADLNHEE